MTGPSRYGLVGVVLERRRGAAHPLPLPGCKQAHSRRSKTMRGGIGIGTVILIIILIVVFF